VTSSEAAQRDKILDRVRALLSMTIENGCSENEAMVAASKAAKLMQDYDFTFSDVSRLKDERIGQASKPFSATNKSRAMHAAGFYAAVAVGNFFDCKVWRDGTEIVFFGLKNDVDLAQAMLGMIRVAMDSELSTFLAAELARGTSEHRMSLSASFCRGMGQRVSQRLGRLKFKRTAANRATGKDLVVLKGAIVTEAYAKAFPNARPRKAKPSKPHSSEIGYMAGIEAAERVNLVHREVADGESSQRTTAKPAPAAKTRPAPQHAAAKPTSAVAEIIAGLKTKRTGWGFWFGTAAISVGVFLLGIGYVAGLLLSFIGVTLAFDSGSGAGGFRFGPEFDWIPRWLALMGGPLALVAAMQGMARYQIIRGLSLSDYDRWRLELSRFDRALRTEQFDKAFFPFRTAREYLKSFERKPQWIARCALLAGSALVSTYILGFE